MIDQPEDDLGAGHTHMTLLLFTTDADVDCITSDWTAWDNTGVTTVFYRSEFEIRGNINFDFPFTEFMGLISDGGRIVDLRKLQKEKP